MTAPTGIDLRRLRDYPAVADLERRALDEDPTKLAAAANRLARHLFELTDIDLRSMRPPIGTVESEPYASCALAPEDQVEVFRRHGWDVTGVTGEPLRILPFLNLGLLAACLGLAGRLPDPPEVETWGASLEQEARRFRQRQTATVVRRGDRNRGRPGPGAVRQP